jgi:uncharacterized membrane protein
MRLTKRRNQREVMSMRKILIAVGTAAVIAATTLTGASTANAGWRYGWGHGWGHGWRYGGWHYGGWRSGLGYSGWAYGYGGGYAAPAVSVARYVYYPTASYHYANYGYYPYNYAAYPVYSGYWRGCGC